MYLPPILNARIGILDPKGYSEYLIVIMVQDGWVSEDSSDETPWEVWGVYPSYFSVELSGSFRTPSRGGAGAWGIQPETVDMEVEYTPYRALCEAVACGHTVEVLFVQRGGGGEYRVTHTADGSVSGWWPALNNGRDEGARLAFAEAVAVNGGDVTRICARVPSESESSMNLPVFVVDCEGNEWRSVDVMQTVRTLATKSGMENRAINVFDASELNTLMERTDNAAAWLERVTRIKGKHAQGWHKRVTVACAVEYVNVTDIRERFTVLCTVVADAGEATFVDVQRMGGERGGTAPLRMVRLFATRLAEDLSAPYGLDSAGRLQRRDRRL